MSLVPTAAASLLVLFGAAQELIITNPRVATPPPAAPAASAPAPVLAPTSPAVGTAEAAAITQATRAISAPDPTDDADVIPNGAPADDYEFVAWCSGILSGHMELFGRVKPELDAISKRWNTLEQDEKDYALQREEGRKAQALFTRSMRAAEAASPREITPRGQAAIAAGVGMWQQINSVDKTNQAYSWLNWGLPARCEKVATELEQRSILAAAVLRESKGLAPVAPRAPALPRP